MLRLVLCGGAVRSVLLMCHVRFLPRSPNIAEVRLFRATGVRLMYVYIAGRVALPIMTLTVHR